MLNYNRDYQNGFNAGLATVSNQRGSSSGSLAEYNELVAEYDELLAEHNARVEMIKYFANEILPKYDPDHPLTKRENRRKLFAEFLEREKKELKMR